MKSDATNDRAPIVDRLATRYPDRPRAYIESLVERHWQAYRNATVRSFVPVLVSREAAAELRRD